MNTITIYGRRYQVASFDTDKQANAFIAAKAHKGEQWGVISVDLQGVNVANCLDSGSPA